jgi:hypothetical protein
MARYLNTVDELIDFIKRRLGSPVHAIEITDDQWLDIIENAKTIFYDYSDFGQYTQYVVIDPQGHNSVILSDDVLAIQSCYGLISDVSNIANIAYPADTLFYAMIRDGAQNISLSSYVIMKQYLNTFKDLFREPVLYNFNNESKRLQLSKSSYSAIGFEMIMMESIDKLVNNKFFKLLVESQAWSQWATNVGGKYDVSKASIIGNGLSLNYEGMLKKAETLMTEVMDGLEGEEFGSLLEPRRLYD